MDKGCCVTQTCPNRVALDVHKTSNTVSVRYETYLALVSTAKGFSKSKPDHIKHSEH